MGIKFLCTQCGHKLNVKSFLAGKKGICPKCQARVDIPGQRLDGKPSRAESGANQQQAAFEALGLDPGPIAQPAAAMPAGGIPMGGAAYATPAVMPRPTPTPAMQATASKVVAPVTPAPVAMPAAMPVQTPMAYAAPAMPMAAMPQAAAVPMAAQPAYAAAAPAMAVAAPAMPPAPPAAPADPIAEAPNAVWYVRPPSGGQFGPAAGDTMRKWVGEGRVTAESLIWREGWGDWKKANSAFPSLGGTAVAEPVSAARPAAASTPPATKPAPAGNQMAIIIVVLLVVLTVVLLGVLVYVLNGMPKGDADPKKSTAAVPAAVLLLHDGKA